MSDARLRIAVQKSGRLADKSMETFAAAGLRFEPGRNDLYLRAKNAPLDLLRVRDDDIPEIVSTSACDIGVVGRNVLEEHTIASGEQPVPELLAELGFSRCTLKLAVAQELSYTDVTSLSGKRIATSYPGLTRQFMNRAKVQCEIVNLSGAVEIAPRLNMADAISDIVATGATLEANGLHAVETIMESEALLIGAPTVLCETKQTIRDRLLPRLRGVIASAETKYIMLNAPVAALAQIERLLPGQSAPTVTPLAGRNDMVAVHAVCGETVFWETLEQLKGAGASAILVLPIEKMMA